MGLKITKGNVKTKPAPQVAMPYKVSKDELAREARYRAEDDLRTMQRAAEVKSDPSRVKAAQQMADEQMRALQSIKKL